MLAVLVATLFAAVVAAMRIVSLAPSFTEILYAIGAGPQVVGVDTYSTQPAAARALPQIGSMNGINSEIVLGLRPNLVVGMTSSEPQLAQFSSLGIATRALPIDTLADCYAMIATLGRLTGHVDGAAALAARIRDRLAATSRATARFSRPRALVIIDTQPIFVAGGGSYIDDLLRAAHVVNVAGGIRTTFPQVSAEAVEAANPDVLIVGNDVKLPANVPPWSRIRAVREHRIVRLDDDDLSRPGPRIPAVLDALVRAVAPYRGTARSTNVTTRPPGS
jgi:iron complex transport system substrate-binding protein